MIGQTVGSYRVLAVLGEGGMGTVFVGEHTLLGRRAAIKVLRPEMSASASIVTRFFNEARVITSISDPGIVQVFDYGVHEGRAFIVMELLEGETIQARLKQHGRLPAAEVLRLGRQIATSLFAAHNKSIVHRDLKPENIFIIGDPAVTGGERTKILDFGIAKLLQKDDSDPDSQHTQTGMLMGTPVYMSPEQCRGAGEVDHRSDIYSLGCVLFRMLGGRPPFQGRGSGELIASHLKEPAPRLSTLVPDVPPALEELVQQCLAKDPAQRPQSALELANLLGTVEQGPTYQTPVPGFAAAIDLEARTIPMTPSRTLLDETATPTTMQVASGETTPASTSRKRSLGLFAGIAAACVVTGGIIAVATSKGGATTVRASDAPPPSEPAPAAAAPTPDPAPSATPVEPPPVEPVAADPVAADPAPVEPPPVDEPPTPPPTKTTKPTRTTKPTKPTKTTKPTKPPAKPAPAPRIDRGD